MATRTQTLAALAKLMEKIDIAMLTTVGPGGHLVSRPLSTQDVSFDGERVWFFTSARSPKVGEIARNPKVNLAYASKGRNTYVSASGHARVNRDQARIDQYWNDAMKAFFPGGKGDPDLTLVEVALASVEYWDGPSSWVGKAVAFVAARVTGNDDLMAENRIVDVATGRSRRAPGSDTGGNRANATRKAAAPLRRTASKKPAAKGAATRAVSKARPNQAAAKVGSRNAVKTAAKKATSKTAKPAGTRKPAAKKTAARKSAGGGARARGTAEARRRTRQR